MQPGTTFRNRGQAIIALVFAIAIFLILPVGLLGFEISRSHLARLQLSSATDAAALAAVASLAGQDDTDTMNAHNQAVRCAINMFRQNLVMGHVMSDAQQTSGDVSNPAAEKSYVMVEFIDPTTQQVVQLGDPKGKCVRVTSTFGLEPAFGNFLGIGAVPIHAISTGGVPDLDIVVCFDVSGSIDDQTPITFVRRQWQGDAATGKIVYIVPPTRAGAPAGASASGPIYDIIGPPATGTRVNAVYPHYLSSSSQSGVRWPLSFSEQGGSSQGLRGRTDAGAPPGNIPPNPSGTGNNFTYTDVVVNLDGNKVFGGHTEDGYGFPDLATLVEAARGNLENATVFQSSKANTSVPVQPRAGYQSAYRSLAKKKLQPINAAKDATIEFFQIMNTNTRCHFGFVAFSDNAGQTAGGTQFGYNVDQSYPQAGTGQFPLPNVPLNPSVNQTNFAEITERIPNLVATTSTNIGDAVHKAVQQLKSNGRPTANKAIVLFTDGEPTAGGPFSSDPWSNARQAAVEAHSEGIPIYAIGLAQNPEIIPSEISILNDTNPNPTTGGMVAIAGNNGKFFLVTDANNLRKTFEHIARCLVQLVK